MSTDSGVEFQFLKPTRPQRAFQDWFFRYMEEASTRSGAGRAFDRITRQRIGWPPSQHVRYHTPSFEDDRWRLWEGLTKKTIRYSCCSRGTGRRSPRQK